MLTEDTRATGVKGKWCLTVPQNKAQAKSIEPAKDEVAQPEVDSGGECIMKAAVNVLRWRRGAGIFRGGMAKNRSYSPSSSPPPSSSKTSTGGYTFDRLPAAPKSNLHHPNASTGGSGSHNPPSGLLLDTMLGTVFGLGTSLLIMETGTFYPTSQGDDGAATASPPPQWMSPAIPLVPGRSVVSETLCGPLTREFRRFPKQLWRSVRGRNSGVENGHNNHVALYANSGWKGSGYHGGNKNAEVVSLGEAGPAPSGREGEYERLLLDSLQGFVVNCQRRSRQEGRLRGERAVSLRAALGAAAPVVIPDDGVACEDDLELDDIYFPGDDGGLDGGEVVNAGDGFGL